MRRPAFAGPTRDPDAVAADLEAVRQERFAFVASLSANIRASLSDLDQPPDPLPALLDHTLRAEGRRAVQTLLDRGHAAGLLPAVRAEYAPEP